MGQTLAALSTPLSWVYPAPPAGQARAIPATPVMPAITARNYRYGLTGDAPPWRPVSVYDDGRRVYVEFPGGIVQGEMPPIFVIGPDGEAEIANSRVYQNTLIVDRLFGAAELRLGSGKRQQTVRIVRTDATRRGLSMSGTNAAPNAKDAFRQRGGEHS